MEDMRLIAVVGGSGSGKTWLAAKLAGWFGGEAVHLCLDNFYRDLGHLSGPEREDVNFDDPGAIDWDALQTVLESLERGEVAQVPVYDFAEHVRKRDFVEVESRRVVVLEGLWLLHPEWLREKFALSVFVDCPEEVRLLRRMERDVITRGRTEESVRKQFAEHVQPMHARFVEPQRERSMLCVSSPLLEGEQVELMAACRG
ncbi:MAG: uridine kinase [Luteolibacter sp.]